MTDEDENWYIFPKNLPDVPPGSFVLVIFDGVGGGNDDIDFNDNIATLHSQPGLIDIFEDDSDQVSLYGKRSNIVYLPSILQSNNSISVYHSGEGIVYSSNERTYWNGTRDILAHVAWGTNPKDDAINASEAGLWNENWFVSLYRGIGFSSPDTHLSSGETIGLNLEHQTKYKEDWDLYQVNETTPGKDNIVPAISWYYPDASAVIDGETFSIGWNAVNGAMAYHFQMDDSINLNSPEFDIQLNQPVFSPITTIPEGTYYWRVKVIFPSNESSWTIPVEVNSLLSPVIVSSLNIQEGQSISLITENVLGISWQLQHKDTLMLDMDGSPETGQARWDSSHERDGDLTIGNGAPLRANELDNMYCVRASISMMVSYYDGNLSQDRISYQFYGTGPPEGDLGHGQGPGPDPDSVDTVLSWALGTSIISIDGKPTFEQIKNWIDGGQPIVSVIPGHMRVIDGYREWDLNLGKIQEIHILDPWSIEMWVMYAFDNIGHVWVGPNFTPSGVKSDEDIDQDGILDTVDDSDGDGVADFDERNRFSLDPNNPDSDGDNVMDKSDIREYVFTNEGEYSPKHSDVDRDGFRKERDKDNDNGGAIDGCEDTNGNGKLEPGLGETDNFNPSDEKGCGTSNVFVINKTNDTLCYEVLNTGIGEVCSSSPEFFYGSFPSRVYSWRAITWGGILEGSVYYCDGIATHTFE